ncbi:HEPN domain-containing protein [uncultured Tateyamaria sp.]|uniref:HEPN domain-containing protein n=1 Tax=uncultured Tateyamaria sp. TaxID=455651 RepID=UPI00260FD247|nr:HEPN domain-containing protein [uncultured Tateyamaria sp.]
MPNQFFVVSPILHPCRLIKASPITLGGNISIRTIKSEHFGAILKKSPSHASLIKPNSKSIIIDCADQPPIHDTISYDLLSCTFALNAFSDRGSVIHHNPVTIRFNRVHSATEIHDHQAVAAADNHDFALKAGTTPADVAAVYSSVRSAVNRDPKLSISLRRYNAAMAKTSPDEKVIDLAICLESMFASQTEISFQFALYNTVMAEASAEKRHDVYKLLKNFYRWRSKIVHGTHSLDQPWFDENWGKIVRLATLSVLSKTAFISANEPGGWTEHLEKIVLGVETVV